jgi:hypothetical protein
MKGVEQSVASGEGAKSIDSEAAKSLLLIASYFTPKLR